MPSKTVITESTRDEGLGTEGIIAVISLVIAVIALVPAVIQLSIEASTEARRRGKTDRLALGDWAVGWPQLRLFIFDIYTALHIRSPLDDPKIIAVPFITLQALWECLDNEARAEHRKPLDRRMASRLIPEATEVIATGGGQFSGRMYRVRSKTRKRVEACWADAMDMCGITKRFWPEGFVTAASALSCDGNIRPASAVTNVHSLWGFTRAMGLRRLKSEGDTVSMSNGGATISLRCNLSAERPTRYAHFSGSPNGRYRIVEEISQHTAESIYAEAVWSSGCVPSSDRLDPGRAVPRTKTTAKFSALKVDWPSDMPAPPILDRSAPYGRNLELLESWVSTVSHDARPGFVSYLDMIDKGHSAVITCIRSYPRNRLSPQQKLACHTAFVWCVNHWWMDVFQRRRTRDSDNIPQIPKPHIEWISAEFVTAVDQAHEWCSKADDGDTKTVPVPEKHWQACLAFSLQKPSNETGEVKDELKLSDSGRIVLEKVLQTWKLHEFCLNFRTGTSVSQIKLEDRAAVITKRSAARAMLLLLSMALLGTATDSAVLGSSEDNKALEVELGCDT